jgi:hypothetical protein
MLSVVAPFPALFVGRYGDRGAHRPAYGLRQVEQEVGALSHAAAHATGEATSEVSSDLYGGRAGEGAGSRVHTFLGGGLRGYGPLLFLSEPLSLGELAALPLAGVASGTHIREVGKVRQEMVHPLLVGRR